MGVLHERPRIVTEVDMSLLNVIDDNSGDRQSAPAISRSERALRRFDVVLALMLMVVGLLPAALLLCFGRVRSIVVHHEGRSFAQYFYEPSSRWGSIPSQDSALCAWPMVFNILKGEMTWIGPTVPGMTALNGAVVLDRKHALGLTNPWALRRRTGVNLGSENEVLADYQSQRSLSKDLALLLRALLVLALPKAPDHAAAKVTLGDVQMDNLTMEDAIAAIECFLDEKSGTRQVCFVNPACVNIAAGNKVYRRILKQATLVLADGIGLKIAGDILRTPIRQNVNGTDLFPRLCEMLNRRDTLNSTGPRFASLANAMAFSRRHKKHASPRRFETPRPISSWWLAAFPCKMSSSIAIVKCWA
jgi:hypothetical protein